MTFQFLNEKKGSGAISINPLYRWYHKIFKRHKLSNLGKGNPFNWQIGYDVRDTIGPITIKNQGNNDSCGGQAGAYAMEILRRMKGLNEGEISAKSIYAPIAYPGGGTTVPALITQLCTRGANTEFVISSYDANGNPLSESMMEDLSWRTPQTVQDAFARAGYTPLNIPIDMDDIASAIASYGMVIWEIRGEVNGTWASPSPQPPKTPGGNGEFFSHFMCLFGANNRNDQPTLMALESEGLSQGIQGIQFFNQNYIDSGYIVDCFTLIPDSQIDSLPEVMSPWNALLVWFKKLGKGIMMK